MNVVSKLGQIAQRQTLRAALKRAYTDFANRYGDWAEYLFDEHFVTTRIAPLLITGTFPSATTVVNAWADQMTWPKQQSRQQQIADLVPAASHFLQMVEAELSVSRSIDHAMPQTT